MAKYKIKTWGDRVLIKPDPVKSAYQSDVLMFPDILKDFDGDLPRTGKIIDLGPKCTKNVRVGQRVMFAKFGVNNFEYNGEKYTMCLERDILAEIC